MATAAAGEAVTGPLLRRVVGPEEAASMVEHDYLFKLLLVGDSAVGKSSLVLRFADGKWSPSFIATVGVDFRVLAFELATATSATKVVKLQVWDTAGQERFRAICQSYYRGAHAVVVCFDASDADSLRNVRRVWLPEIARFAREDVHVVLAANKMDLVAASESLAAARRAPRLNDAGHRDGEARDAAAAATVGGGVVGDAAASRQPLRAPMSEALATMPLGDELEALCDEFRLDAMGVSARSGAGVEEAFTAVVRTLLSEAMARDALVGGHGGGGYRVPGRGDKRLPLGKRVGGAVDDEGSCCTIM
mmetsp:Transcript_23056/g.80379  ORF Transcript_23056/g.80379 Transcript_23056/m.80379 type:complete len:306 (-) Transcript_23056:64-981(-)|eukprot:CAMPEP_0203813800 /NCGR_PEP_ID=MMETSP0115-20131106/4926_1 /ASSEMBLY_ACC=CAM_ASM_000227 /TAXON_ID=33651 /ORGANISM="Bicosoecid sp, Strain ms1" /LENGTH=305 /DNA_ID=CAMNT_0050722679 /DNA_START=215 /DNA_END=1132 /DNA_ORIENTATION=+